MGAQRLRRTGLLASTLGAAVATSLLLPAAAAAAATTQPAPQKFEVKVIATGLDNPRGIILGPDGSLLVAEAGKGGTGKCLPSPEGGQSCLGLSSAVTRMWRTSHGADASTATDRRFSSASAERSASGWSAKRIVTGLPSLAAPDGSGALGLHNLAFRKDTLLGTIGLGSNPTQRATLGPDGSLLGHLVQFGPKGVSPVTDLAAFEAAKNPDAKDNGSAVDSNPYGLLGTSSGAIATDAGGNDVLAIDKRGKVSVLAVLHARQVKAPPPSPSAPASNAAAKIWMQAVPTTVVCGPDGALYVGQLTGFPFPPGGAKVWRIEPGHKPTVYASGFTNIIDIAFDHKGRLLVLEISKNGLLSNDPTGALIRVEKNGKWTEIAPKALTMPGGVVVGRDALYVTNKSVFPGGGEVLRIDD
jgi:hypothetical protein